MYIVHSDHTLPSYSLPTLNAPPTFMSLFLFFDLSLRRTTYVGTDVVESNLESRLILIKILTLIFKISQCLVSLVRVICILKVSHCHPDLIIEPNSTDVIQYN